MRGCWVLVALLGPAAHALAPSKGLKAVRVEASAKPFHDIASVALNPRLAGSALVAVAAATPLCASAAAPEWVAPTATFLGPGLFFVQFVMLVSCIPGQSYGKLGARPALLVPRDRREQAPLEPLRLAYGTPPP